jgi:MSHA pilin protein MshA
MKTLTNNGFKQQKGFTLIELVVVIVILGILAATAAPKFIDLTSDARTSVMQGVQGSINSAVNLVHAKALVEGQTGATGVISVGGSNYTLVNGYPAGAAVASGANAGLGLASLIELENGSDITITDGTPAVVTHSGASVANTCNLSYANATGAENPPILTATLTAC